MTRVLLLMATRTYRAEAFIKAAARLGLEITVGTEVEQPLAGLAPGATMALDFRRPRRAQQQIVEFSKRFHLDAVVGVDDDTVLLAAMAADALGLPHNSVESVKAARYKDVMRLIIAESDLPSPSFELVEIDDDPSSIADRLRYPSVLKPLSLSASRGVIRADNPAKFVAAFREVVDIIAQADLPPDDPGARQVLVEDFIPGREVSLEGMLVDGRLTVLALFDKPDPLDGPYFEETIYVTPSRLPEKTQQTIAVTTSRVAATLGLREGPVHAELRVNDDGVWVVEIASRSIGGYCSSSLRFEAGRSLEELILRQAARLEPTSLQRQPRPSGVMMIPIPAAGILRGVDGCDEASAVPGVDEVRISIPLGQELIPPPRGSKYLGFIFARAGTPAAVEAALRVAHSLLRFQIGSSAGQHATALPVEAATLPTSIP